MSKITKCKKCDKTYQCELKGVEFTARTISLVRFRVIGCDKKGRFVIE